MIVVKDGIRYSVLDCTHTLIPVGVEDNVTAFLHSIRHTHTRNSELVTLHGGRVDIINLQNLELKPNLSDRDNINSEYCNKKRKNRIKAINQKNLKLPEIGPTSQTIRKRTEITRRIQEDIKSLEEIYSPIPITCKKTGFLLGWQSVEISSQLDYINTNKETSEIAKHNSVYRIHPAFIDVSPEKLKELQLAMPVEYCIYTADLLAIETIKPEVKYKYWQFLKQIDLQLIVECAELHRLGLAMFGKKRLDSAYSMIRTPAMPQFQVENFVHYIGNFRHWLKKMVLCFQKALHKADTTRRRKITLADIAQVTLDLGRSDFRQARIGKYNDDAVYWDVKNLLSELDFTPVYNPNVYGKKTTTFTGKLKTLSEAVKTEKPKYKEETSGFSLDLDLSKFNVK